ncbi:uncharacterized protein LOC142184333 isoform X1 [Leptodactylus fuscus]|uniref:uncharacterized protein LOC142184333 isoform X1 n=2 Tax=Leptodactylus fuscus TaxID=238119 RepID=UPI003F4F3A02
MCRAEMALSPVTEESPNYEEALQQRDSLSGAPSYSTDSSESISDESNGRHQSDACDSMTDEQSDKYLSDSFETFAGESSREQKSDSYSSITSDSPRSYGSESLESLSSGLDARQSYSSEKSSIQSTSVEDEHKENDQGVHQESSGSEHKALQSYCSLKIQHLSQPPKRHRPKNRQQPALPSGAEIAQQSSPVPRELMNRLELQRIKESINQVISTEIHDPASCPDCCNKQAELAKCHFIRMKKSKLESDLLHKKMEEYAYSKDLVTCIGEILQSLPKPSEERSVIWQRLHNSVTKT